MRLDLYLAKAGLVGSRERAKKLILKGLVCVNGVVAMRPSTEIAAEDDVTLLADPFRFVGRGGEKLEFALLTFGIDPAGRRAVDIGASTGGFTDCLLQHGAASVVALDAGSGQLDAGLLADPRVKNLEKYNARFLRPADIGAVELAVMDVSFISATYIIPRVAELLPQGGIFVCLIKPQFEAGRTALNRQGVVRRAEDKIFAIQRVLASAGDAGLALTGLAPSPIFGGDGNEEFLACFRCIGKKVDNSAVPVEKTVMEGWCFRAGNCIDHKF